MSRLVRVFEPGNASVDLADPASKIAGLHLLFGEIRDKPRGNGPMRFVFPRLNDGGLWMGVGSEGG